MNRIDNKVAVVTGGTQGIGAAIALLFARAGAAGIVIVGRDMDKGRKVADEIETNSGLPVLVIAADLARMDNVRRVMAETDARFGRVDILVNAAGLTGRGNHLNTSTGLFDRMFAVNVPRHDRAEIEVSIARHGEGGPLDDRVEEALRSAVEIVDHAQAHVLCVDVADAPMVAIDHSQGVASGECEVPAVVR